ncbi:MAG TPA: sensor histidine kinase, partial [Steroidobacter sp.]
IRLEERVNERTRIARELHDSLLQSFQGLIFRLQAVQALLPDRVPEAAALLEKTMDHSDRAIEEGRAAVQDLRSNVPVASDLSEAIAALGQELTVDGQAPLSFRVVVEGEPQRVAPLVRDDVYRIAREALRNAFQHSQGRRIEGELHYGEKALILRIRDDGVGIDAKIVRGEQRAGHWGLQGMRERAESLGARLDVWSEVNAGTEIELSIPAPIAYERARTHRSWFRVNTLWKRA